MGIPASINKIPPAYVPADHYSGSVRDYLALLKPRVMVLVVFTGVAGLVIAPGLIHPFLASVAILCIALSSGGAAAINMWYEQDLDRLMKRTQQRPLVRGVIPPSEALALGIILNIFSFVLMGLATNWLAAGLLAAASFFYIFIYTVWLKRLTPQNIVIGGAAGSFPPLIGWAAVTGRIELFPVLLFLIIFLWTPPHFWSLALYRSDDYKAAGIPMLPVVRGRFITCLNIVGYLILLMTVSIMPWLLGKAGIFYGITALISGLIWFSEAIKLLWKDDHRIAKKSFSFSILYLFILFIALIIDYYFR